jgi:Concanavalin A-like lectin/glucanases superfamily
MSYSYAFAYNPDQLPIGEGYTQQYGDITVGFPSNYEWAKFPVISRWWEGPDLSTQYIIAWSNTGNTQPTSVSGITASVQFWGSVNGYGLTDQGFIDTVNTFPRFVGDPYVPTPYSGVTKLNNNYYTNYGLVNGSMQLNGTSYASANLTGSTPGTGAFTYECFFKKTNLTNQGGLWNTRSGNTSDGFDVAVTTSGSVIVTWASTTLMQTDANLIIPKEWYHIAVVRAGVIWKLFINGILRSSYTSGQDLTSSTMYVGCQALGTNKFVGNISNFRYTIGALYTNNFTPDTNYLNPVSSTEFCMNTFVGDLWFVDDSHNFYPLTAVGTPANSSDSPFYYISTSGLQLYLDAGNFVSYPGSGTTWYDLSPNHNNAILTATTYTIGSGALTFNGTTSKGSFSAPTNIPTGNTQYTISVWFNAASTGGSKGFIGWGQYGTPNRVNALKLNGSQYVNYWWSNDLAGGNVTINNWINVVVLCNGVFRYLLVNGNFITEDYVGNVTHAVPNASNLTVGVTNGTEFYNGQISQVLVYNRAISFNEVYNNYLAVHPRYV